MDTSVIHPPLSPFKMAFWLPCHVPSSNFNRWRLEYQCWHLPGWWPTSTHCRNHWTKNRSRKLPPPWRKETFGGNSFPPPNHKRQGWKISKWNAIKQKRTIGNICKYYHFWTYKWSFKLFLFEYFSFDPTTFLFPPYSLYGFHGFPLNVSLTFPTCCLVHDTKLHASYSSLKHSRKRFGF